MIPAVCMLPSLLSNLKIIRNTLESDVLARHLFKIFPLTSNLVLISTCLAAIVANRRDSQHLNGDPLTFISSDVIFAIQAVGGVFLLGFVWIAFFILKSAEGRRQGLASLTYAVVTFVAKCFFYQRVFGLMILDVIFISFYENLMYKKRIVLFGSFVFSIFCEVGFTFFVLTEMRMMGVSQVMRVAVFSIGTIRFFYNVFAYFYLRYRVLKRLFPRAAAERERALPNQTLDAPLIQLNGDLRL
jgi:hypothetical protein